MKRRNVVSSPAKRGKFQSEHLFTDIDNLYGIVWHPIDHGELYTTEIGKRAISSTAWVSVYLLKQVDGWDA
jgi:hypothetical protein